MKYALLIHEDEDLYADEAAWNDIIRRHMTFGQEMSGKIAGGEGLRPVETATTLQKRNGSVDFHDGPYAEAKEQLGGFYIIDVADLDEAMAVAKKVPLAGDGAVEIRPCITEA